jgi:hypothetical protein
MNVSLQGFSIYTTRVSHFQGKELFTLRIRNPKSVNRAAIFSKEERGLTEEREREQLP